MDIHTIVLGVGALFFGILLCLVAYGIIGRNFTQKEFHSWLENRRGFYKILGPILIIAGIVILVI